MTELKFHPLVCPHSTYKAGDKIYLFGFSRGAYTARALAGMLQQGAHGPSHYLFSQS